MPPSAAQSICLMVKSAARANGLPVEFFARVIWQESRFRADAVGPVTRSGERAQGIAQFMPGTAAERNLLNPLDPVQALPKSAEFLRELRAEFGNLGLAAAAYNAGPRRVHDWIKGAGSMPSETRSYVLNITGAPVEQWASRAQTPTTRRRSGRDCDTLMALLKREPNRFVAALTQHVVLGDMLPWGSILGASNSRDQHARQKYADFSDAMPRSWPGRDPILIERKRGPLPRYQVRIGAQTRAVANELCQQNLQGARRLRGAAQSERLATRARRPRPRSARWRRAPAAGPAPRPRRTAPAGRRGVAATLCRLRGIRGCRCETAGHARHWTVTCRRLRRVSAILPMMNSACASAEEEKCGWRGSIAVAGARPRRRMPSGPT